MKPEKDAPRTGYAPYHLRVNPCGCRSVPDGIHLPGCKHYSPLPKAQRQEGIDLIGGGAAYIDNPEDAA